MAQAFEKLERDAAHRRTMSREYVGLPYDLEQIADDFAAPLHGTKAFERWRTQMFEPLAPELKALLVTHGRLGATHVVVVVGSGVAGPEAIDRPGCRAPQYR